MKMNREKSYQETFRRKVTPAKRNESFKIPRQWKYRIYEFYFQEEPQRAPENSKSIFKDENCLCVDMGMREKLKIKAIFG